MNYDGFSNVVDVYVGYLRKKLEVPFDRTLIRTVAGWGTGLGCREPADPPPDHDLVRRVARGRAYRPRRRSSTLRLRAGLVDGLDDSLATRAAQISLGLQGGCEGEFQDVSDAALVGLPQGESASAAADHRTARCSSLPEIAAAEQPDARSRTTSARSVAAGRDPCEERCAQGRTREAFRVLAVAAPPGHVLRGDRRGHVDGRGRSIRAGTAAPALDRRPDRAVGRGSRWLVAGGRAPWHPWRG